MIVACVMDGSDGTIVPEEDAKIAHVGRVYCDQAPGQPWSIVSDIVTGEPKSLPGSWGREFDDESHRGILFPHNGGDDTKLVEHVMQKDLLTTRPSNERMIQTTVKRRRQEATVRCCTDKVQVCQY